MADPIVPNPLGQTAPPSTLPRDPLSAQRMKDEAAKKAAEEAGTPLPAVAPSVAPVIDFDADPRNLAPAKESRDVVDMREADSANWARRARDVSLAAVFGSNLQNMSEDERIRQMQDTPFWTAEKNARAKSHIDFFAKARKDPNSREFKTLSNDTYMYAMGEQLYAEAEVAERQGQRHEWYEAKLKYDPIALAAYIKFAESDGGGSASRIRKMLKPKITWSEAGAMLKEGVTMYAMNTDFEIKGLKIKAINRFKAPFETAIKSLETAGDNITKAKLGFASVVNNYKSGKDYDQTKVSRILEIDSKDPDFYLGGGKGATAYDRMVKELTPTEQAAVMLGLEHKVVTDKDGKVRPYREGIDDSKSARPMSFADFDLNMVTSTGLDEVDLVANDDFAVMGMGSPSQGAGYARAMIQGKQWGEKEARRAPRLQAGKIDPARWFSDNKGKGLLSEVETVTGAAGKGILGAAYNIYISPLEQSYTSGVADFLTPFVYNHRPNSFWWDAKNFIAGNDTLEEKMAFLDASMAADKYSMDAMAGKYTSAADTVVGVFADKERQQRIRIGMQNWGFATEGTGSYGVLKFDPMMAAGGVVNLGSASIRGSSAIQRAIKAGILSEEAVGKIVKAVEIGQDYLMTAPMKAAGWVAGKAGTAIAYMPAVLAEGIVRLSAKTLKAAALLDKTADVDKFVRRAMYTVGFTDAFFMGGWSSRLAFAWGFGKATEASGHLIGKYFDLRLDGYGFRGAMSHAATNSSLPSLARSTAKVLAEGGIFTKTAWDTAKGTYAGVGIGFSMGWMNGDLHDGFDAAVMGAGMGGAGSVHAGGANYLAGRTHHDMARKLLDEQSKNMDDETKELLTKRLNQAEFDADYEFAPRLVSSLEKLNKLGVKTVLASTDALSRNAMLRATDLLKLDDADMTVTVGGTTRTFDIKSKHQAVYDIKQKMEIAKAAGEMDTLRKLKEDLNVAETSKIKEINEYLAAVKTSGNVDLIEKVGTGQLFNGVYRVEDDGNQFVFLNLDAMDSTTSSHETFHAIQRLVGQTTSARHFAAIGLGIKFGQIGPNGQRGETVFQKGLMDADDLMEYGSLYYNRMFRNSPARLEAKMKDLDAAVKEMKLLGERGVLSESSHRILKDAAEEMGAEWFENFVSRKPQDLLYFGGKYGKLRQMSDRMVMYLRHNTIIDANAAGIKANLRKNNQEMQSNMAERQRLAKTRGQIDQMMKNNFDKISAMSKAEGISLEKARNKLLKTDIEFRRRDDMVNTYKDAERKAQYFETGGIFTNKDGTHLVVEEVDRYFQDILAAESDKPLSIELSLSSMSGPMLASHLASLGLEHHGYVDASGVTRLKDRKQIDAEEAARGKRTMEVIGNLPPARSGVVRTVDANGNIRLVGNLSDEALAILTSDKFDVNGHSHSTMPAGVALKVRTLRDAVLSTTNTGNNDFNVMQMLYSGLSKENEGGGRTRKPHGVVEQTYRRIVPYRMELVMTTKDRDGNKVDPHFEVMCTAIDLGVIYKRMANEFNASYVLPSGQVIKVSDVFGGDMEMFHSMFQTYLHNISKSVDAQPSAEVFGGGERGAAIRDIMYRVLGTIPEGGHDFNGKPLAYNNPIIRPFDSWERGPDFPFTTFRVDLMSHLEQLPERITFNEEYGYSRAVGNYQPPSLTKSVPLSNGKSLLHEYEGDVDSTVKSKKNLPVAYQILESEGSFTLSSSQLDRPMTFKSKKQAEDFINLDFQRQSAVYNSAQQMPINYRMNGVVVGSFGGKYMLLNNFKGGKFKAMTSTTFSTFGEAIKAAAVMHNQLALESVNTNTKMDEKTKSLIRNQLNVILASPSSPEALPSRIDVDEDGNVKYKEVTKEVDGEDVTQVYEAKDAEVINGLVKAGDPKYAIAIQKVDYNLTKLLTGQSNLREGNRQMQAAGKKLGGHLVNFMLENLGDPEVMKGFKWYMDFSERGYKVFGNLFPMMCEALGATSARTPVEPNFQQAAEFVRKFSLGHYDKKIQLIVQRMEELHNLAESKAPDGSTNNAFWVERNRKHAFELIFKSKSFHENVGLPAGMTAAAYRKNLQNIPPEVQQKVAAAIEAKTQDPKFKLTPAKKREFILDAEKEILAMDDTILFRDNDKKFNMNSAKVTMVAVSHFFSKSTGPKTPQFARNLMGVDHQATIDVWAARTLHRIINTVMLKNKEAWRILPSMEMPVDGEVLRMGTPEMPVITGKGDFFLGQEAFRHAVEILKSQHSDKFDGFKNLTPANLQALLWFAEKKVYERNGWTSTTGAAKASFEGPLDRYFGPSDPSGVETGGSVRRVLFGVSMTNETNRDIGFAINDKGERVTIPYPVSYRRMPAPLRVTEGIGASIIKEYGGNVVGLTVMPSIGGYGGGIEDNVYIHVSMEKGSQIKLANAVNEVDGSIANAENLIAQKAEEKRTASPERAAELETEMQGKRREIAKLKEDRVKAAQALAGDVSPSVNANQFPRMVDMVIQMGKQYQQSDILAHEVVGKNHPNARPMRTVQFNRSINGFEAQQMMRRFNAEEGRSSLAFTLEPDPRNPNSNKIDLLGRDIERLEGDYRKAKTDEQREAILASIDEAKSKILGLQRFTSMYTVAVPEFMWKFGKGDTENVSDWESRLTVDWAKEAMGKWETDFDARLTAVQQFMADSPTAHAEWKKRQAKRKGKADAADPEPERVGFGITQTMTDHVNSLVVSSSGYDYFDVSQSGANVSLEQHIQRYKDETARERETKTSVSDADNVVGPNVTPARDIAGGLRGSPTEQAGVQRGGPESGEGTVQGKAGDANRGRLSSEQATEWIGTRKAKGVQTQAGFLFGDADMTVLQVSDAKGQLTSEFRVNERGATVIKFKNKKEADAYIIGRLTGTEKARHEPRKVSFNGKLYDMVAGLNATPSGTYPPLKDGDNPAVPRTPLQTDANKGIYAPDEDIFGFNIKVDDDMFQPTRITKEEDAEYLRAIAEGDMLAARRMVIMAMKRSEYRGIYYRGTRYTERKHWKRLGQNVGKYGENRFSAMWMYKSREKAENWAASRIPQNTRTVLPLAIRGEQFDATNPDSRKRIQKIFDADIKAIKSEMAEARKNNDDERFTALGAQEAEIRMDWKAIQKTSHYGYFENATESRGRGAMDKSPWIIRAMKKAGFTSYAEQEGTKSIEGMDGTGVLSQYAVMKLSDVKLMDPITYAEDGSVVPLSMRFDPTKDDINYQPPRFEPRRQKNPFGSKTFDEVFPYAPTAARQILIPRDAYSDRVEQQLTALQDMLDRTIGAGKLIVVIEHINNFDSSGSSHQKRTNGYMKIQIRDAQDLSRVQNGILHGHRDGINLSSLEFKYEDGMRTGGYVHYGQSINELTSARRLADGTEFIDYSGVWQELVNKISVNYGSNLDQADIQKLRDITLIPQVPTAMGHGERLKIANDQLQASGFLDVVKGLGSLAYQEVAARLHASGTGRKQDTTQGLKGGVVNRTGSLFAARERAFGKGNTEYRLDDGDISDLAGAFKVAYLASGLEPWKIMPALQEFMTTGEYPKQLDMSQHVGKINYQKNRIGKGIFGEFASQNFNFAKDITVETRPLGNASLMTLNPKVAEWFRGLDTVDTRSFVDENAMYQNINWAKYKPNPELSGKRYGYKRGGNGSMPHRASVDASEVIWPDYIGGDRGDAIVLGLLTSRYNKFGGKDNEENVKELLEMTKRLTGKNYSDIILELAKKHKAAGKIVTEGAFALNGYGMKMAYEGARITLQTAALKNLVTWLRSQSGETNAQRTMTKEFDSSAQQNMIEGIGGAHHGKVRETWESLANELERAFMRTSEQMVDDPHDRVNNLDADAISNAYLTTAIREALVARFEADGVPYDSYKQVLEDVFGYLLNEQRANKYSRNNEQSDILARLNFQRSFPTIRMASPDVADIISLMIAGPSIGSSLNDSYHKFDTETLGKTGDLVAASKVDNDSVKPADEGAIRKGLEEALGLKGPELDMAYQFVIAGNWTNLFGTTSVSGDDSLGAKAYVNYPRGGTSMNAQQIRDQFGLDVQGDATFVRQSNLGFKSFMLGGEKASWGVEYQMTNHEDFIRGAANIFNRQLESLNELVRYSMGTDANQSGTTIKSAGEEVALRENGQYLDVEKKYTSMKELKADIKALQDLKKRALAAYQGKAVEEVSLKAKPYKQVMAERIASGQLVSIGDLFKELRTYGIKRISVKEMLELTKMSTESRPIETGLENNAALFSEQKDFQLLMFLDGISGLQNEGDSNMVSVIDEDTRGWARGGKDQWAARSSKGDYLFRTDGDMRTILEEYHHHLMQNNDTYRTLYASSSTDSPTGAAWKKDFLASVDGLEAALRKEITDASAKHDGTTYAYANSERAAAKAIGSMALCTLARLWVRSFDVDRRNFGLSKTLSKASSNRVNSDSPASDILFSTDQPATKSGGRLSKGDQTYTNLDKFYYGGMEKDYHFKNLIEFAAGAMNDAHVQSVLAQQDPIADKHGRDPLQGLVDDLQATGNSHVKAYAKRYQEVMKKARNLLDQLVGLIKIMAQFGQTSNHSLQGTTYARNKVIQNQEKIQSKRTALEQALEASASVKPRHMGAHSELPFTGNKTFQTPQMADKYDLKSGAFREDVLGKYLGRVRGNFKGKPEQQ